MFSSEYSQKMRIVWQEETMTSLFSTKFCSNPGISDHVADDRQNCFLGSFQGYLPSKSKRELKWEWFPFWGSIAVLHALSNGTRMVHYVVVKSLLKIIVTVTRDVFIIYALVEHSVSWRRQTPPPPDADLPCHVTCNACWEAILLWTEGVTHTCENITLPQISFAGGNYDPFVSGFGTRTVDKI